VCRCWPVSFYRQQSFFLQLLLNDDKLLGDHWVNKRWNNIINWTIIIILFALSLILAAQVMAPSLFPAQS
jgi:Mn2+/Fe2+ NRAMP family transporter